MIYVTVYAALILFRLALVGQPKLARQVYPIILSLLFLFSAFRFEVGCDWSGYLKQWEIQQDSSFRDALDASEPLWWAVMEIVHSLGLPYPWVNVVSSAMFFAGAHSLARRQPDRLSFLILLYPVLILQMPMSGIRQGVAIGIMCVAYGAFIDRRLVKYVALTLLAAGFHSSALILLLLAPLVRGELSLGRLLLALPLALVGGAVLLTGEIAAVAAERYLNSGVEAGGGIYRVGILTISGLLYLILMRKRWARDFPRDAKLALIGSLIMVAALPIVVVSSVIGDRIAYYMIPLQAMIFARIPFLFKGKIRLILASGPYLGLGALLSYWVYASFIYVICYREYRSWLLGFPEDITYVF
ncbi:EpsG family protein [Thermaurantiacus sp.]